ncbi:MAG: GNAT family N-acetyltransferase [Chitinophagales bacterium]|nr:GNAT family N-acetyltransferase [Chitinophagaceae bacterium]MCB9064395.1 GNAT family N-acetyltransferase [Chitinophagales bacterium]
MEINTYKSVEDLNDNEFSVIRDFLFEHLDQFGDAKEDIAKAMDYSLGKGGNPGGFILSTSDNGNVVGAVVVNETGMKGYIPENILVYIATHKDYRGKGVGKQLMLKAMDTANGDVALHVEPDNPARHLYQKLGFTNKYLEMRYKKG